MSLPRENRLTRSREIQRVREKGRRINAGPYLVFFMRREEGLGDPPRLCVVTSRRVGPAVSRNRARRRMKELFRAALEDLPRGLDMVIIARRSLPDHPFPDLRTRFAKTVVQANREYPQTS